MPLGLAERLFLLLFFSATEDSMLFGRTGLYEASVGFVCFLEGRYFASVFTRGLTLNVFWL